MEKKNEMEEYPYKRILIRGGQVVNEDRVFLADVLIQGGLIREVKENLIVADESDVEVIDANGKYVIPGGVDPHTHLQIPFMGTVSVDDFYTGTKAALMGGTTTIIDYVLPYKEKSLLERYHQWREWADNNVCCDYGLQVAVTNWNENVKKEMRELVRDHGVNAFKMYMAFKDTLQVESCEMIDIMSTCKELGALAKVHAENGDIIAENQKRIFAAGVIGPEGDEQSRPEEVEREATVRAIMLANQTKCPLYIVHVRSKQAAKEVIEARREGYIVFGETLAATLACSGSHHYDKCWRDAAAFLTSTPLRLDPTTPTVSMNLLANGDLQITASGHCTFNSEQKAAGRNDFRLIPTGFNGIEERMSVIWEKGVVSGILDPCMFVAVTSSNAAKIHNIYPKKGRIEVGSDADIVVWDADVNRTISAATHHTAGDFNIFEGMTVHGKPLHVISNGRIVVRDGTVNVARGSGRFLRMDPYAPAVYARMIQRDKVCGWKKVERHE